MGFVIDEIYELEFKDRDMQVRATGTDTGTMLKLLEARSDPRVSGEEFAVMTAHALMDKRTLDDGSTMPPCIVSWNLERHDGSLVPLTFEGLMSIGFRHVSSILRVWIDAQVAIPVPLDESSNSGAQSLGELPMTAA